MTTFKEVVEQELTKIVDSGALNKIIEHQLKETLKDTVRSTMGRFTEFSNIIEKKIKEQILTDSINLSLPEYHQFIKQTLEREYIAVIEQDAQEHLKKVVDKLAEPFVQEMPLSALLYELRDLINQELDETYELENCLSVAQDVNSESIIIFVVENGRMNGSKFILYQHPVENHYYIGYVQDGDRVLTSHVRKKADFPTDRTTDLMFKYWATGTKFEVDLSTSDFEALELN